MANHEPRLTADTVESPLPRDRHGVFRERSGVSTTREKWIWIWPLSDLPDLHSFATGLKRDYAAVRNGLTLPHSSGAVEGNVNKLKGLKRQMFGRAKLDLLRKRVLLAG